jgi:hypothetical protein
MDSLGEAYRRRPLEGGSCPADIGLQPSAETVDDCGSPEDFPACAEHRLGNRKQSYTSVHGCGDSADQGGRGHVLPIADQEGLIPRRRVPK